MDLIELKETDRPFYNVIMQLRQESAAKKTTLSHLNRQVKEVEAQIADSDTLNPNEVLYQSDTSDSTDSEEEETSELSHFEKVYTLELKENMNLICQVRRTKRRLRAMERYIRSKGEIPLSTLLTDQSQVEDQQLKMNKEMEMLNLGDGT